MFETKYLIIIGVILCLLVLYYFYDEISNIKKTFLPTYQKTMALEAKLLEYEKQYEKSNGKFSSIRKKSKLESPIMSITYVSADATNNPDGTSSIQYANISDLEAKELLGALNKDNKNIIPVPPPPKNLDIEIRDFANIKSNDSLMANNAPNNTHDTPTAISHKSGQATQIKPSDSALNNKKLDDSDIWDDINNINNDLHYSLRDDTPNNDGYLDVELDMNVIKSISDSVHKVELPIEGTYSDIPISKLNEYKAKHKKKLSSKHM